MKIKTLATTTTIAVLLLLTSGFAQQQAPSVGSGNPEIDNLVNLGPGIQDIKKENGLLKSLKVVGQSRIPSSLGAAKGVEIATGRAKLSAQKEYIEWIKSNVKSIRSSGLETIVSLDSSSTGPTESGKGTETDTNSVLTQAEGLVRGLTLIGKQVDPSTQTLSLVFGWSVANTDLTRQAEDANNRPAGTTNITAPGGGTQLDTTVKSQTVVSPAIKDY